MYTQSQQQIFEHTHAKHKYIYIESSSLWLWPTVSLMPLLPTESSPNISCRGSAVPPNTLAHYEDPFIW